MSWLKKAILYHVFVDRFYGDMNGDPKKPLFLGGTIKGITKKLDYISGLGANTLWISPFYQTKKYHGYHITDYFNVDPHFGNLKDLKNLIKKTHKKKMKIVADFVPNHCSNKHPIFLEAKRDKKSKYREWFYFNKKGDYKCFMGYKELPQLNLDNGGARDYMIEIARYWLSLGIDGFRIDYAIGPSHKFWRVFSNFLKKEFPNKIIFGEIRTSNFDSSANKYCTEFNGAIDFRFNDLIKKYVHGRISLSKLQNNLKKHYLKFPKNFSLISFLSNHDMNRFMFECGNDESKFLESIKIQFDQNQPKAIYYGDEIGMTHKKPIESASCGDLLARQPMDFSQKVKFYKE